LTFAALALVGVVLGYLVLLVRYGPLKAGVLAYRTISVGVVELLKTSPARVSALAWLAIKESFRRRVWVGFVVFAAILVFAGWFLPSGDYKDPGKLYLSFVLTATSYLTLLLALLLSTFSLPGDFKTKTIYTIVTKPVRAGDIVLGRMVGFTLIGTVMLAAMGAVSFVFVNRSLDHRHEYTAAALEEEFDPNGKVIGKRGETDLSQRHRHTLELSPDGYGLALAHHGHTHSITPNSVAGGGDGGVGLSSGAENLLRARVPKRGDIHFLDPNGVRKEEGVNVGSEWTYRSFIQGGTQAAAVWTFEGVDETVLAGGNGEPEYLPVELIIRVFRTYAGDINRAIQGSIQLRNPQPKIVDGQEVYTTNNIETFGAKDDTIDYFEFPREQFDKNMNQIDLLDDLVSDDGRLEVVVQCLERSQYYGFARADCYIRLPESSPGWNFFKGYVGIWVQMVIVITIGVAASTFLNGPIAMISTTSFILLGFFRNFLIGVATGVQPDGTKVYGGGPIEALVRIPTRMNLTKPFDENSLTVQLMKWTDEYVIGGLLKSVSYILPDFSTLSSVNYVAEGFSIPGAVIGRELAIALAYLVGLAVFGYFFLRTREVAK
ncbi:MAG: hypothetical protein AAF790_13345, partial [Planctomycetota bacterium]